MRCCFMNYGDIELEGTPITFSILSDQPTTVHVYTWKKIDNQNS